jgi:hypothetical protein
MAKAFVEIRKQSPKGRFPRCGPDTYVSVQIVPQGKKRLVYLNRKVAEKRGIVLLYCGQGYEKNQGPRSMLGKAIRQADRIASEINNC